MGPTGAQRGPAEIKPPKLNYILSIVLVLLKPSSVALIHPNRPNDAPKGPQAIPRGKVGGRRGPEATFGTPKAPPRDPPKRPFWALMIFTNLVVFFSIVKEIWVVSHFVCDLFKSINNILRVLRGPQQVILL